MITGWAAAMQPDDFNSFDLPQLEPAMARPDLFLYEMIQLSDNGINRARTWQVVQKGCLFFSEL